MNASAAALPKTIVFSHANGFGAGCYRVLFDVWRAAGWEVFALPQFGHDPAFPVSSNWPHTRDELIHFIEHEVQPRMARPGPVMLVGHSLGGMLSLLTASRRPELAQGLLMLDSPVVGGWRAHSIRMAKATKLIERISPGKVSRQRRHEWPSREAVHAHFASKHKFARWDARVLDDYVATGFEERSDGKTHMLFRREIETKFYNTLPHHLDGLLKRRPLRCPVAFIGATQSEELRQAGAGASKALARKHFVWFEGSHLFPFEQPEATAALVLQLLETLRAEHGR